jgi:hypothetical protein
MVAILLLPLLRMLTLLLLLVLLLLQGTAGVEKDRNAKDESNRAILKMLGEGDAGHLGALDPCRLAIAQLFAVKVRA